MMAYDVKMVKPQTPLLVYMARVSPQWTVGWIFARHFIYQRLMSLNLFLSLITCIYIYIYVSEQDSFSSSFLSFFLSSYLNGHVEIILTFYINFIQKNNDKIENVRGQEGNEREKKAICIMLFKWHCRHAFFHFSFYLLGKS